MKVESSSNAFLFSVGLAPIDTALSENTVYVLESMLQTSASKR